MCVLTHHPRDARVSYIQEQRTSAAERVDHRQPGALEPQRRDNGEQEGPRPRRGTGEREKLLNSALRADGLTPR